VWIFGGRCNLIVDILFFFPFWKVINVCVVVVIWNKVLFILISCLSTMDLDVRQKRTRVISVAMCL